MRNAPLDDYRIGIDNTTNEVVVILTAGGLNTTIRLNPSDTQEVVNALQRALQQLDKLSKH